MFATTKLIAGNPNAGADSPAAEGAPRPNAEGVKDTARLPDLGDNDQRALFHAFLRQHPGLKQITVNSTPDANFKIEGSDVSRQQAVLCPQYDGTFILQGGKPDLTNKNTVSQADASYTLALDGEDRVIVQPGNIVRISGVYALTIPEGPSYLQLDMSAKLAAWLNSAMREVREYTEHTGPAHLQFTLGQKEAGRYGDFSELDTAIHGELPRLPDNQLHVAVSKEPTNGQWQLAVWNGDTLERPNWLRLPNDGTQTREWQKISSSAWTPCEPGAEISLGGCYRFIVPDLHAGS